ncbi:MAG: alanine dehydrogenase [Candidatus Nanopelagicales bacterium]
MIVGIPKEIKNNEFRVAITPDGVHELTAHGHQVLVEKNAGLGSSITNEDYELAGAKIINKQKEIWDAAELILKVKEPIESEYQLLQKDQVLFTYLHLAASRPCTQALLDSGTTAIAYETVEDAAGHLPLLAPMSEVAGRLASQVGANTLMKPNQGRGVLLSGVPSVESARVVVIGGGVAGLSAARIALGLGAQVTILDNNINRLREIDLQFEGRIKTVISNKFQIEKQVKNADLVIGAVLVTGAKAPKLVSNKLVTRMKPGSVLVDIAIDQGGCFEDSRPTTHDNPIFKVHESIFYCVANMPGAVPHTSTYALTNATLPYVMKLVTIGWKAAFESDFGFAKGLNVHAGLITQRALSNEFNLPLTDLTNILK